MKLPEISNIDWLPVVAVAIAAFAGQSIARKMAVVALLTVAVSWLMGNAGALLIAPAAGAVLIVLIARKPGTVPFLARLAAGGAAVCGAVLLYLFPVPQAPAEDDMLEVGTRIVGIPEGGPSDPALVVQIWYPARQAAGEAAWWLPDKSLAPRFPFHRMAAAKIGAEADAPVAERAERWPVVFYEHAWLGHRNENVAQLLGLARRGFVVVAVDHPGQAERVTYQNGKSVPGHLPAVPDFSSGQSIASFENDARHLMADRVRAIERVRSALAGGLVPDLGASARWLRMGVFGFSFGGSTALHLCASHPEFVAGANEDGLYLDVGEPRGPFLFFDQEMPPWLLEKPGPSESAEQAMVRRAEHRTLQAMDKPGRQRHILAGTTHASFSDRKFLSPLPWITRTGNRKPRDVHEAILSPLALFFQEHLGNPVIGSDGNQPGNR